jgi:riboflavin biosynthesis pyrimidine reductase
VGRQYLAAGLIDELSLHIAPVLLGGGTRMFGDGTPASHPFAIKSVVHSPCATHLRYTIRS